jgi:hypothetical protein
MHNDQNTERSARRGKYLIKALDCIETPLMAAFRAARNGSREPANRALRQFDLWRIRPVRTVTKAQHSTLRNEGR